MTDSDAQSPAPAEQKSVSGPVREEPPVERGWLQTGVVYGSGAPLDARDSKRLAGD